MANENRNVFDPKAFDPSKYSQRSYSVAQNTLINHAFAWMGVGLLLSGLIAFFVSGTPAHIYFLQNPWISIGSIIIQFGLVFAISAGVTSQRISASAMIMFFLLYSGLMGLSLASIFLVYTKQSVYGVFFISAAMFLATALYGYTTKSDLTQLGNLLVMMLLGLVIATVVNIFLKSNALNTIVSFLGVIIFVGLTAYDTQKLKEIGNGLNKGSEEYNKASIWGALTLYLDFINIFLFLLRLMGNNKEN